MERQSCSTPLIVKRPSAVERRQYLFWIILMGFASGFTLLFPSQILMTWMLDSGYSLHSVGWVSCLMAPYLCSFLWMPWIDYYTQTGVVSRVSLICTGFLLYACLMYMCSTVLVGQSYIVILALGFLMAMIGATQDHIMEAYRLNVLPTWDYKLGVSLSLVAFRVGVMLAGGGGLLLAATYGWSNAYMCAASVMLGLAVLVSCAPKCQTEVVEVALSTHMNGAKEFVVGLLKSHWFVSFLITHRLSIFWLEVMMPAFLLRFVGMSVFDVGMVYKFYGMCGLLLGGVLINVWVDATRLLRVLYQCLVLQVLLCLAFVYVSMMPVYTEVWVSILVFCECVIQGMLGTISTIWLMQKTHRDMPAFSFSIWYGLGGLGRVSIGPIAVSVIQTYGWAGYMVSGAVLGILSLFVCHRYSQAVTRYA